MKLKNVLAESYTVSDDGKVYTVKLRQGVKFQDGTDFNAEAVKVNLDRASNPESHLKRYNLYKNIDKTEVVDPQTVKITLKQPFSAFINILAHPATAMISPAALKKYGNEIGFHPVGPAVPAGYLESDRLREGQQVRQLLAKRAAEAGLHYLASGGRQQYPRGDAANR